MTPTTSTSTTLAPGGQVAAAACPWKDERTGQPNTFYGPAPTSVALAPGVTLPAGATVYAPSADTLLVAPSGFHCTATTSVDDDVRTVTIVDPANAGHFEVFNGGGSVQLDTRVAATSPRSAPSQLSLTIAPRLRPA